MNNDYLAHYGILGMHWGIRRFQPYPKGYSGDGKFTGKKLTPRRMNKEQNKVYSLYGKGMTVDQISKKTGINRDAVNDYLDGGFGPVKGKAAKAGAERAYNGGLVIPTKEQDLKNRIKRENRDYPDAKEYNEWKMEEIVKVLDKANYYKTPEKIVAGKEKTNEYFDKTIDDLYKKSLKEPISEAEMERIKDAIRNKFDQRQKDSLIQLYANWSETGKKAYEAEQEWMKSESKDPEIKKMIDNWDGDGTELYEELQFRRPNANVEEISRKYSEVWDDWIDGTKAIGKDALSAKYRAKNSVRNTAGGYQAREKGTSMYTIAYDAADSIGPDFEKRAKAMAKSGKTYEQIANSLGISESSVGKLVNL